MTNPDKIKKIPKEYLPSDYEEVMNISLTDKEKQEDWYSIYECPIPSTITYSKFVDYSRDPVCVVEREHRESIDEDSFFVVKTRFSDEGEELILYCDFARFTDNGYETDDALHDEELTGKKFLKYALP